MMKDTSSAKTIKRGVAAAALAVMVIVSTAVITYIMADRQEGAYRQFDAFYAQPPGTVDVLFVGSSRVHSNINPVGLWEDYGISSYCLGINSQPIDTTYYVLKEALKYQQPRVVVVEASQIPSDAEKQDDYPSINGMRYGKEYLGAVLEKCDPNTAVSSILKFPLYHSRYDMLGKDVYLEDEYPAYPVTGAAGYKGAIEYLYSVPFESYTDEYEEKGAEFNETMEGWFDRIVKLCEEKGTKLVFTFTPAVYRFRRSGLDGYFAKHPELTFINTSDHYDEMGIDTQTDFIEEAHMNTFGSMKTGRFYGKYLSENYDLPDHRGDLNYYSWDENTAYHYRKIKDDELAKTNGFGLYFDHFPDKDLVVIVSLLDGYDSEYIGQTDALAHVMCNEAVYALGGTWVVDGQDLVYGVFGYESDEKRPESTGGVTVGYDGKDDPAMRKIANNLHMDIGKRSLEITDDKKGLPCIKIDNVDYSVRKDNGKTKVSKGIEVVVYDRLAEKVVDAVCFDAENGWAATRSEPVSDK